MDKINIRHLSSGTVSIRSLFLLLAYAVLALLLTATRANSDKDATIAPLLNAGQTETLLPDGRWLLLGGVDRNVTYDKAALLDPRTGKTTVLPAGLHVARVGHTATVLPDGTVFVWGGRGTDGQWVGTSERYDASTQTFSKLVVKGLTPRAGHTATLLTDGRLLIAGGTGTSDKPLDTAQLWDPQHPTHLPTTLSLIHARIGAQAQLLSNGQVLLTGGGTSSGAPPLPDEIFDPQKNRFSEVSDPALLPPLTAEPEVVASIPERFAQDAPIDIAITLRFATLMRVETLSAQTVTLIGPAGAVNLQAIPAETGRLLFVHPQISLVPGTSYTLFVSGAKDRGGQTLPFTAIDFTTQALTPKRAASQTVKDTSAALSPSIASGVTAQDVESWKPTAKAMHGDWRAHRPASTFQSLPPLQAKAGVTALAAQVLTLDGNPLPNVTLKIGSVAAKTDGTGRILLRGLPTGAQVLVMDGRSAATGNRHYGFFETRLTIVAGKTNVLPYTIWMPKLDTAHTITVPAPTAAQDTVVTSPLIPGLELHIPKGTVVRGPDGNIETQISITAIPVDRTPFPLPVGVPVPVYFTIQPGGATLESADGTASHGARLIYPNFTHDLPGASINFWNYDPRDRGWYVYGQGTVNANGQQVTPAPGVAIYEFTGAMINTSDGPPGSGPPPGGCGGQGGDPVDCATGLFVEEFTDLVVHDVLPLTVKRTYRTNDSASRRFGIGTNDAYGTFLWSANQYQEADLVTPDGGRIHYVRISPGTSFSDAVFECETAPTDFYKSTIHWNGNGWNLTRKDGLTYVFGENQPLQSIHDRYGNTITLTRSGGTSGNITRVTSPNGKYVAFTYDASNRVTQATDNLGRTVGYTYDASGRLSTVTDAAGGVTVYTYDSANRMLTVKNPRNIVALTNTYDANGRVATQTLGDGGVFHFAYTTDANGKITQTDITDPRGKIRRLGFNGAGYVTSETRALGPPEAQVTTTVRDSANHITSTTDPLGRVTSYTYDVLGNVTSVTRLSGTANASTTSYTYEPVFNQVASITDPLSHSANFTYDALGRLITLTDPISHTTTFTYNTQGQPLTITNGLNKTTQLSYSYGDLASTTDPLGRKALTYHDAAGRLTALVDPMGALTTYTRDALDRLTATTDPLGGITAYVYDADGNLTSLTDANGNKTTFTYDNKDRWASRTDPLLKAESFQYDGNDNLTQYTDRKNQITTYTYDGLNRRSVTTYADAATITNTYDAGNRVTKVVDSTNGTITRGYDGLDNLTSETTPQGTVSYGYDAASRRTGLTVTGQTTVGYSYDNANRLTSLTQGATTVGFSYDAANRRSTLTLPNGLTVNYGYDDANELTSLTYKNGATTLGDLGYSYDAAGRRTQVTGSYARTTMPAALFSATYDVGNRLTSWGSTTLSYDTNGNLLTDGTKTYTYNARNQLASVTGNVTGSFQYDGVDRRQSKTISGVSTAFLYDGLNVVQELAGNTPTVNLLTGLNIDEFFQRTDATGTTYPLTDALGSIIALTDASAAVPSQYTYGPYGGTQVAGTASNEFRFTGREQDGAGLYYFRGRYYSPTYNRWLAEDPIGFAGGVNLYSYAFNAPTRYTDPSGELPPGVIARALAIILAGSQTPGIGTDYHAEEPTRQSPVEPGELPGEELPDPKIDPTNPANNAVSPQPGVQQQPAPQLVPVPTIPPASFRPPVPFIVCPLCNFIYQNDYDKPPSCGV